jgi:hypothetical protein
MNKYNYQTRHCERNPADNEAKNHKYYATAMLPIRASIIGGYYHLFRDGIDADLFQTTSFYFEQLII